MCPEIVVNEIRGNNELLWNNGGISAANQFY